MLFYSEEKGKRIVEKIIIKIAKENIKHSEAFFFFERLTSLPVSTCLASFTLAKFPFPIVFSKR